MKTTIFFALPIAAFIAGCNGDTMTADGGVPDPVKPALAGTQIDRMGRGTINVAVTNPFDLDYTAIGGGANVGATRDKHSKDGNFSQWRSTWTPILAKTLAIYDGVDRNCGNQLGACGMYAGCTVGSTAMAGRYDTLATVLADDQIYMDSTKTDCSLYLAVEAAALAVPNVSTFCGGRTPLADVVDETYTAATVGITGFPSGPGVPFTITDGVLKDNETTDSLTAFPFLSAPN